MAVNVVLLLGLIIRVQSLREVEHSPIEEHPELLERVRSGSNCTDQQLVTINERCSELVKNLIFIVDEYENGLRNYNPDIPSLTYCERGQIACFSHPAWTAAAECACSVCNHIWFYDDALHARFVLYFKNDHQCPGEIPNRMWKMQFCDFMSEPQRKIPPKACQTEQQSEDYIYFEDNPLISNASNMFYKNQAIMIWTVILAITMSISMYVWTR